MGVPDGLRDALADRYALERELGRGGMAVVYLAQDLRHDRPVALKVLLPEFAATLGPERFQREIKLAARLQHPHILTVHDSGEAAGRLWFTMLMAHTRSRELASIPRVRTGWSSRPTKPRSTWLNRRRRLGGRRELRAYSVAVDGSLGPARVLHDRDQEDFELLQNGRFPR